MGGDEKAGCRRDDLPYKLVPGHELYDHPQFTGATEYQEPTVIDPESGSMFPGTWGFYERINNGDLKIKDDDVWLVTYPKAGTTWAYEILLHVLAGGDADKVNQLRDRYREHNMSKIELHMFDVDKYIGNMNSLEEPPRLFCTHLPDKFLPDRVKKNNKMIVVMRNPKDVCVSYYHFHRMNRILGKYTGSFSHFYKAFVQSKVWGGSWFDHTISMWQNHKSDANCLFLKFEDMKEDLESVVRRIAQHLNKDFSEDQVRNIAEVTQFGQMKESTKERFGKAQAFDQTISPFLRKGEVGDWKNHFTAAESEHFDKVYREKMKDIDLTFDFQ